MYSASSSASKSKRSNSGPRTQFSDLSVSVDSALSKNRPNSAPLQAQTAPTSQQVHPAATAPGGHSSGSSSATTPSSDSISLVEQRLRIVKRNRSKSADEGNANASASGFAAVTPKYTLYPLTEVLNTASSPTLRQDAQQVDNIVREVMDVLFFPDVVVL